MSNRRIFRIVALTLVGYYWLLAIVIGGDGPAAGRWAGGLSFLSNWNLTLNLVVALGAIKYEFDGQKRLDIPILGAAMGINIIVVLLFWVLRAMGALGEVQAYDSFAALFQNYYVHLGTSIILFVEAVHYSQPFEDWKRSYGIYMVLFFGYIFWMEAFVSQRDNFPCGEVSCGFPYEFLNDLTTTGRIIFYGGIFAMGNLAFAGSYWLAQFWEQRRDSRNAEENPEYPSTEEAPEEQSFGISAYGASKLKEAKDLLNNGIITEEEFQQIKDEYLQ